jgi:hypothetical protein
MEGEKRRGTRRNCSGRMFILNVGNKHVALYKILGAFVMPIATISLLMSIHLHGETRI